MNDPPRILHLISRLDGYGGARMLRYLAAHQARAGQGVAVAALTGTDAVVKELRDAGVAVHVLGSRWRLDPVALGRLAGLRRRMRDAMVHAWDRRAAQHARLTGRRPPVVTAISPGTPPAAPSLHDRSQALAALRLPVDSRLIALAGPLLRDKQVDEAIWCYELVRVLHPPARLVVFGDGPDGARLERYAELVSELDCVRFAGYRGDLAELLPHADVFWQLTPSRTTPYALLEAMAAGVPAVASDVPAHRAAIVAEQTGFLAALGNRATVARATDRLLSDATFAKGIADAACAAAAANWSLAERLAAYESVYRAISPRSLTGG